MSDILNSESESGPSDGKLITELKVAELRSELEKRGKDKNGVKASLTDRLAAVSPALSLVSVSDTRSLTSGSAGRGS